MIESEAKVQSASLNSLNTSTPIRAIPKTPLADHLLDARHASQFDQPTCFWIQKQAVKLLACLPALMMASAAHNYPYLVHFVRPCTPFWLEIYIVPSKLPVPLLHFSCFEPGLLPTFELTTIQMFRHPGQENEGRLTYRSTQDCLGIHRQSIS